MKTLKDDDDTQYSHVWNGGTFSGVTIGSGYDVTVKRESDTAAIVFVSRVASKEEWMCEIEIAADTNLQREARRIAQCPSAELGGMPTDDDWDGTGGQMECDKGRQPSYILISYTFL